MVDLADAAFEAEGFDPTPNGAAVYAEQVCGFRHGVVFFRVDVCPKVYICHSDF